MLDEHGQTPPKPAAPLSIVNLSDFDETIDWNWLSHRFPQHRWQHFGLGWPRDRGRFGLNAARYRAAWRALSVAAKQPPALIVAHGARPMMHLAETAMLRRLPAPVLVYALNFTDLPNGILRKRMSRSLAMADRLVVPSTVERRLYSEWFGLDERRIDVLLWGLAPTEVPQDPPFIGSSKYICAIGGNARDYRTIVEAMRRLPQIPLVLVCRPHNLAGLDCPPNVTVHVDLSVQQVNNIIHHSSFMALPLQTSTVPCGHVTMVAGMHLKKGMIVTRSEGVLDYVRENDNALLTPVGDAAAFAERIEHLWRHPELAAKFGAAGHAFSQAQCTEDAVTRYCEGYLQSLARQSPAPSASLSRQ
jgi:glycosyltransferase involved in cell wall biosynthesis